MRAWACHDLDYLGVREWLVEWDYRAICSRAGAMIPNLSMYFVSKIKSG